jgi:hypothetical protein
MTPLWDMCFSETHLPGDLPEDQMRRATLQAALVAMFMLVLKASCLHRMTLVPVPEEITHKLNGKPKGIGPLAQSVTGIETKTGKGQGADCSHTAAVALEEIEHRDCHQARLPQGEERVSFTGNSRRHRRWASLHYQKGAVVPLTNTLYS